MKMFLILVCVCLLCVGIGAAMGQDKRTDSADQLIERKYDRFKDETTVKLKPQRILDSKSPRQVLEMSAETTFKGERPRQGDETVRVTFTSLAGENPYQEPLELNFIVDGERVRGAAAGVGIPYNPKTSPGPDLKVARDITAFVSLDALSKVTSGKAVEMRLGSTEHTLDMTTLGNLRKFASAVFNK
jgi:hypothetical protein